MCLAIESFCFVLCKVFRCGNAQNDWKIVRQPTVIVGAICRLDGR